MLGSTGRATPSPYNELSRTTGTTQASTAGTGSRCESLTHDDHRSAGVLAPSPAARARHLLQPQVNAHRLLRRDRSLDPHLHRQTEPPIPPRVLRKAALPPFHPLQPLRLEDPKAFAAETHRLASALQ